MAAPPPQLPYASPAYFPQAIPKYPRQPHLWQQAIANFLGTGANEALKNAMAPTATVGADNNVTLKGGLGGRMAVPASNTLSAAEIAAINKLRGTEGGKNVAETNRINTMTPAEKASMEAGTAFTGAQMGRVNTMLPEEVNRMRAETGEMGQRGRYFSEMAGQVAPTAESERALRGAQAGQIGAETTQIPLTGESTRALQAAEAGRTGAETGLIGAQQRLLGPQTAETQLRYEMLRNFLKNPSGAPSPFTGAVGSGDYKPDFSTPSAAAPSPAATPTPTPTAAPTPSPAMGMNPLVPMLAGHTTPPQGLMPRPTPSTSTLDPQTISALLGLQGLGGQQ